MAVTATPAGGAGAHRGGPTDPSHDQELRRGILHTRISRRLAWALVIPFLLALYAVPIEQYVHDKQAGDESVLMDLFRHAPTRESLRAFEDELDKTSAAREYFRPQVQLELTRLGRYGNKKATVGLGGWLYYTPGVTAVGGPPFLDPAVLAARRTAAQADGDPPLSPDPRPAVLDFARFLAGRGVRLVLFPVPDKASLQPLQLHGRARDVRDVPPAENPDRPRLAAELERAGVAVFDPSPARLSPADPPFFMRQDTHWRPEWMEKVAADLARFLVERGLVPAQPPAGSARAWRAVAQQVSRLGDVTDMLGLPDGQQLFLPETYTIHQVQDPSGTAFEASDHAGVLLLGDSFTNVFSAEQMGWGSSAGLAPQLARALGRDLDVLAQNDAGAHATRQLLYNALAGGDDRLAGKKVVIWELASRELAVGDFKPIDWSTLAAPATGAP